MASDLLQYSLIPYRTIHLFRYTHTQKKSMLDFDHVDFLHYTISVFPIPSSFRLFSLYIEFYKIQSCSIWGRKSRVRIEVSEQDEGYHRPRRWRSGVGGSRCLEGDISMGEMYQYSSSSPSALAPAYNGESFDSFGMTRRSTLCWSDLLALA